LARGPVKSARTWVALVGGVALVMVTGAMAQTPVSPSPAPPGDPPLNTPQLVDRIVAIVDQEPILQSDLQLEIQNYVFEARSTNRTLPEDQSEIHREVMDRLIESKLLVAKAKREGLVIGDDELEAEVDRRMGEVARRFGGDTALRAELARSGMTLEDLRLRNREVTRNRLYSMRIVQAFIRPNVEVLDNDVRAYYDAHLDEIPTQPTTLELAAVLLTPQPSDATAQQIQTRLDQIRGALSEGQDFEGLAQQYSEGPNAKRGGLVGTFSRGDLSNQILEQAAWSLPVGEVSPPIYTDIGLHLIRVDSRTDNDVTLRQIVFRITIGDEDRAEAKRRAERVAELARGGQDFGELARNLSDAPQSREEGGRLGSFTLEQLNPEFRAAVEGLAKGEVSDPTVGNEGYYVFKVLDRRDGAVYSFEEIESQLRTMLLNEKLETELDAYLDELRQDFYIEIKA
jgi:peptidyl-prolyl cis-trans isomerase SurA